ncbi:biopolymer transporter ExbD [Treponema rectale]|uniref:Biopolymer transport protein ExbD n=1 Tax=Treponema rectale TaxID=744512 RepID=A0A840S5S8_9SPIR|nr:biopolymer transporter ExbD [Treponema rectale]MBB5217859.1 biopolymer transport protein ExbD [Treponema rectale]QOS40417.1 biopolymer transporter ExbD [Treponema rectale]
MIRRFIRHKVDDAGSSGSLNDLSFLLIIFFIVIAGFNVNKGFLLNLPSKDKPVTVNCNDIMKCSLCADGTLILDGDAVTLETLSGKISEKISIWPNMTFLLVINPDTSYQNVVDVISYIRKLKVENFSFRMEKPEE